MVFEILFLVGLVGFLAMAGLGMVHGHGDGHGHGGHHAGHGHAGHGHAGPGHDHGHHGDLGTHSPGLGNEILHTLPLLFSPMNLFSMALAMGATGVLLKDKLTGPILWLAAIAGGLLFTFLLIRPMMNLILNFATKPSQGLASQLAHAAEAISNFDANGQGLIRVTVDGEVKQLLATLDPLERERGVTISKGEEVMIAEINADRGTCVVIRET